MMPVTLPDRLIDNLPRVRGQLIADAPLDRIIWFRVGGPAEVLFEPADAEDLAQFLAALHNSAAVSPPVSLIGLGSNVLVRDGGVPGITIRLGAGFDGIEIEGSEVSAGAAALDVAVARACRDGAIEGLEFLSGIPGTVGGALRMNAGAYGTEMADVTLFADAIDGTGKRHRLDSTALGFSYRHSAVPEGWIFTRVVLRGRPGEASKISRRMADIAATRKDSQPRTRTGGSTFTNPPEARAWELIEAAGCRGLSIGGAQVSEQHCNFLINTGTASAADLEALGEEVRRRVWDFSGVELRWEIRRIGIATPGPKAGGAS